MGDGSTVLKAVFEPMQQSNPTQEAVKRLGTAIRLGILPPGTQLPPERELADQLCINRSTLRRALTTLVESGHLMALRGRGGGTFVAESPPISSGRQTERLQDQLQPLLDQRLAVEAGATVLAAERAQAAELDTLDEAIERMRVAATYEDYRRADVRFHIGIAEAAHSPRLVAAITEVHGELNDVMVAMDHPAERLNHSNEQHRQLSDLLRRGDPIKAVFLMRQHVEQTSRSLAPRTKGAG